jgi:hypothetical protein
LEVDEMADALATPMTLESFLAWEERQELRRRPHEGGWQNRRRRRGPDQRAADLHR